jgi:hypothetical protein
MLNEKLQLLVDSIAIHYGSINRASTNQQLPSRECPLECFFKKNQLLLSCWINDCISVYYSDINQQLPKIIP